MSNTTNTLRPRAYLDGIDVARMAFTPLADLSSPVDARELPQYSLAELSFLFEIPKPTLHAWSRPSTLKGKPIPPLVIPADKTAAQFSFYNLVEVHILSLTTRIHGMKIANVRRATEEIRAESVHDLTHPLLSEDFHTDGRHIWLKRLEKRVDLSQFGQLGLAEILDTYLERIVRDDLFKPKKIYPARQVGKVISIASAVSSGRPTIDGTGIPVASIWNRFKAGDSIDFLADDYEIPVDLIQGAVSYVEQLSSIA